MCEVVRSNYDEIIPTIEYHIKQADFIAVDTEFTGLKLCESQRPSLFDSGEERYQKLRTSVSQFSIPQIGLSAFIRHPEENTYVVYSYNFHLFPSSFGPIDVKFVVQSSSFEFLSKHKFNFNKYIYDGISFLNQTQEMTLKRFLDKKEHLKGLDRDVDEKALQEFCSQVAVWLIKAEEGAHLAMDISVDVPILVVITELKERFQNIWVTEQDAKIIVEKVSSEQRKHLDANHSKCDQTSIMNRMLGFTRIFRVLSTSGKILVGHNCLTDLILMYDKFHKPLPEKYSTFKADITSMFTKVFDTKHIAMNLRRLPSLEDTGLFEHTGLGELYKTFDSDKGRLFVLQSPNIIHGAGCDRYRADHCPHEAGYDAFMCGYVFIRVAHIQAALITESLELRPLTFYDYLDALRPFTNCVNLIRGSVNNVRLDDHDPHSQRPQWLFVRSRKLQQNLVLAELARLFSAHGSVDIQLRSPKEALVAVSNHRSSRDILEAFRKHHALRVTCYSPWKHSPTVRRAMWGGVLFFGTISVMTLYSAFQATRNVR